jgi:hypothetical protein
MYETKGSFARSYGYACMYVYVCVCMYKQALVTELPIPPVLENIETGIDFFCISGHTIFISLSLSLSLSLLYVTGKGKNKGEVGSELYSGS